MKPGSFKQVQSLLDDISAINAGGCGVSALTLHRWRKSNHKRDIGTFVLLYEDNYELKHNQQAIQDDDYDNLIVPCHIVLKINGRYYDSTGTIDPYIYDAIQEGINETILLHLLNDARDGWNDCFDRDEIETIQDLTGIDLSDVER